MLTKIKKRDGRIVDFEPGRIARCIVKAAEALGYKDFTKEAQRLEAEIVGALELKFNDENPPDVETTQDYVEEALMRNGYFKIAKAYHDYRVRHNELRAFRSTFFETAKIVDDYTQRSDWRACYDEETEVLTKKGWKKFSEISEEDEFLTIDPVSRVLTYQCPTAIYRFDYEGEMIRIGNPSSSRSKGVSLLVTPNHRILVEHRERDSNATWKLSFKRADQISKFTPIPVKGVWIGENREYFILPAVKITRRAPHSTKIVTLEIPEKKVDMDAWLQFFGLFLSEGSLIKGGTHKSYGISISQKKPHVRKQIRETLKKLPFRFSEEKHSFRVYGKQLYEYLKQFGKQQERFIPEEIKQLSPQKLEILWRYLLLGDGYIGRGHKCYYTTSKRLADDIQEILIKMGHATFLRIVEPEFMNKYKHLIGNRNIKHKHTIFIVSERKTRRYYSNGISKIPYKGKVYCVSVPTKTLCVRRGGTPVFCGNSENANISYSIGGLILHVSSSVIARFVLDKVYPPEISDSHVSGDFHIHDLGFGIAGYCAGWSMGQLLLEGFNAPGRLHSNPPKHLNTALIQMINFLGTLQNEWAGAQAFNSVDVYLAPFVREDKLDYRKVKQEIQQFIYNLNIASRWGLQPPFSNITFAWKVPEDLANQPAIVGGKPLDRTYSEFEEEMEMINRAFIEVLSEGDAKQRPFSFPIPTYNLTKDFEWDSELSRMLFGMAGKFGLPYFQNFVNSDLKPSDVRSMCCRLRLRLDEIRRNVTGGLFGSSDSTGSVGVVTINMPRLGYLSKDEDEFFERLAYLMELAKRSLEHKREFVEKNIKNGLLPYTKRYLGSLRNHFSTIGLVGMHEALLNMFGFGIDHPDGRAFAIKTLKFMREKTVEFQKETGHLYNLEATPAEGTSYRLAKIDRQKYPDIIASGESVPFYTNSTQLPVNSSLSLFEALRHQEELQTLYTGGTVFHIFLGEAFPDPEGVGALLKKIVHKTRLPYLTLTPTYSICPDHGYISGEHFKCPICGKDADVYSRVVGYYRPVQNWNIGKREEFRLRNEYEPSKL